MKPWLRPQVPAYIRQEQSTQRGSSHANPCPTGISAIGPHFSELSNLHTLDISTPNKYRVEQSDCAHLADALGTLRALRDLSLSGARVNDSGWSEIALRLAASPLTSLDISRCGLSNQFSLLPSSYATDAASMHGGTSSEANTAGSNDGTCSHRTSTTGSEVSSGFVDTGGGGEVNSPGTHSARGMHDTLQVLNLSGNHLHLPALRQGGLEQLQDLANLRTLSLGNQTRDEYFTTDRDRSFVRMAGPGANFALRSLDVSQVKYAKFTEDLCAVLRHQTALTALCLRDTSVHVGVAEALRGLPYLQELRIGECSELWEHDRWASSLPFPHGMQTCVSHLPAFCARSAIGHTVAQFISPINANSLIN